MKRRKDSGQVNHLLLWIGTKRELSQEPASNAVRLKLEVIAVKGRAHKQLWSIQKSENSHVCHFLPSIKICIWQIYFILYF